MCPCCEIHTLEKIKAEGGAVVGEKSQIPGVGWLVMCVDTEEILYQKNACKRQNCNGTDLQCGVNAVCVHVKNQIKIAKKASLR